MAKSKNPHRMALFRFGLISPVVQGTFPDASPLAYYRRVTENPLEPPDGEPKMYKPKTLQRWELLYREGGLDALAVLERSDKGVSRAITGDCAAAIYETKQKFPRISATLVHEKLLRGGDISADVSLRSVQRFIKANGLKGCAFASAKDRKAFEEEFFGGMWQADSTYFPYIADEGGMLRRTYLIAIIDDHSRMAVAAEIFFNDNSANFQKVFKRAAAAYGIPNKLYTDSGSPYANNQLEFICADIGTKLLHAPVRDGSAKGKIERLFRTIKQGWLYGIDHTGIGSIGEFNRMLADRVRQYNLAVHSATGATPMDRFMASKDRAKAPPSREWLDERFMNRATRRVRADATLRIDKASYDAPMQFIRQTVEVRFLPGQPDSAYILWEKRKFPLRLTDKVENGRTRRASPAAIDYSKMGGRTIV